MIVLCFTSRHENINIYNDGLEIYSACMIIEQGRINILTAKEIHQWENCESPNYRCWTRLIHSSDPGIPRGQSCRARHYPPDGNTCSYTWGAAPNQGDRSHQCWLALQATNNNNNNKCVSVESSLFLIVFEHSNTLLMATMHRSMFNWLQNTFIRRF